MNKRQNKKKLKKIAIRVKFLNSHVIYNGRKNGKTLLFKNLIKAFYSKSYKPFKKFKKVYEKMFLSIDWSNGKDYTAMTTFKTHDKVMRIVKTEIIEDDGLEGLAPHAVVIDEYQNYI